MRGSIPAVLLSLSLCTAHGQFFTNYGAQEGLTNQDLGSVVRDPQGFLWVTSQEGTWRFDGERFRRFDLDRPVKGGAPRDIAEGLAQAPDGTIWIASMHAGLLRFDPATEHWVSWTEMTGDTLADEFMIGPAICVLSNDSILVGAVNRGIFLYLVRERRMQRVVAPLPVRLFHTSHILRDRSHLRRFWISASGAFYAYDLGSDSLQRVRLNDSDDPDQGISVNFLTQRSDGAVWLSTWGDGLIRYDPGTDSSRCWLFDTIPPLTGAKNVEFAMAAMNEDEFWVGTHRGLRRFSEQTGFGPLIDHDPEDANSLTGGWVKGVLLDQEGNLWCATQSGLSCMAPGQNRFHSFTFGKAYYRGDQQPGIQATLELGDRFLVATDDLGLFLIDREHGREEHLQLLDAKGKKITDPHVIDMFRCGEGPIELRTGAGAFLLDPASWRIRPVLQRTIARFGQLDMLGSLCDTAGWVWTGAPFGLYHTNSDKDTGYAYDRNAPPGYRVDRARWAQGIARDRSGHTWFSVNETGIGRVPPNGSPVEVMTPAGSAWLPTPNVWDLTVDPNNRLWLGTRGYGLVTTPADDPGGPGTRSLSTPEGMGTSIGTVMTDHAGDIWAAGPSGLYRVNGDDMRVKRFRTDDGLRSAAFLHDKITQHASGLITIEHHNTLLWFHPDSLDEPLTAPRVWIDGASVNGLPVTRDSTLNAAPHLRLPHDSNYVDIHFSAVALTQRHRITLEYRLVGNSERWVSTAASGSAIFTALPPGDYTFEVRAAGMVDAPVTRLALTIVPAFWQTSWFKALVALLLAGAITFAVRWRLKNGRRQERLRSDFERRIGEVEMSALRAQMNPHFLFNSLNSINRYIVKHEPRIASEYLTKFSRLMRSVLNNSKEKLVPLKDELEALTLYIDLEALRFTNKFDLRSQVEVDRDPALIMVPPLMLQPFVENAIWHGLMQKKEGEAVLSLHVSHQQGVLRCTIEDNGIGRAQAAAIRSLSAIQRPSYGTRITQERLDLLKRLYGMEVQVVYTDLMDAAQRPLGTRVTLTIQQQEPWNPN